MSCVVSRRAASPRVVLAAVLAVLAGLLPAAPSLALASLSGVPDVLAASVAVDSEIAAADGAVSALAHLADGASPETLAAAATALGLVPGSFFGGIGVLHVTGDAAALRALATSGLVSRIEHDAPISALTDSSHVATRGQEVLDGTALNGVSFDGSGIGVAVVDSGIYDSHPDLTDRVVGNVKVVPILGTAVPLSDSDVVSLGGHGTHVSGIIAGTGAASAGRYHGAAPGASLYGVSAGALVSVNAALESLQWVLDNHDRVTPAIRVVNNSWGSSGDGTYDPSDALSRMIRALVADGVVVVWAAGNDGGDGTRATTSPTCVEPTPGSICVAAYDDEDRGTRDGGIADFSSRGTDGAVATYPDLAAPGSSIVATCSIVMPICATGGADLEYATLSGTSMAAPHIAGIVAQLLEANPDLTPAEVEDILEDTASPLASSSVGYPDASNPSSVTTFDAGHGLVDVVAALTEALARHGG